MSEVGFEKRRRDRRSPNRARKKAYTRYVGYQRRQCQTSINIADQEALELALPLAREKKMGVVAKRPIANVHPQRSGVCTAIVGTKNAERWAANARLLQSGSLGESEYEEIRERWEDVAPKTWIGQT